MPIKKLFDVGETDLFHIRFGCKGITQITIPETVVRIEMRAFMGCENLKSVTFENTLGWHIGNNEATTDLTNPISNAEYLTNLYANKYFYSDRLFDRAQENFSFVHGCKICNCVSCAIGVIY